MKKVLDVRYSEQYYEDKGKNKTVKNICKQNVKILSLLQRGKNNRDGLME